MKNVLHIIEDQIWERAATRVCCVWSSTRSSIHAGTSTNSHARNVRESARMLVQVQVEMETQPIGEFINNYPIENYNERC